MLDLVRITDPAARPVTAADLRAHLRLDSTDQDAYLEGLIDAAVRNIEAMSNRAIITQVWRLGLVSFWAGDLELPYSPLQTVDTVTYVDTDGETQTLDAANYEAVTGALVGRVRFAHGVSLPGVRVQSSSVRVTYTAGWGDAAADVPPDVKHAVKLLAAHWYANAEPVSSVSSNVVPDTLRRLVQGFTARGAT